MSARKQDVVVQTTNAVVSATPMDLIASAVAAGADIDKLQKLMDLQQRWEANEARKAYVAAIAQFKSNPPEIVKSKRVYFESQKGVTDFKHATLADVCAAAIKGLADVGISHRWEIDQTADRITVHCVLTHVMGHSERTTLSSPSDPSGSKNPIQAIASAVSYLERYSLLAATGLAARDMQEDEGKAACPDTEPADYQRWKADIAAVADNGLEALKAAWLASAATLRDYAMKNDRQWWADTKVKANA